MSRNKKKNLFPNYPADEITSHGPKPRSKKKFSSSGAGSSRSSLVPG